MVMAGVDLRGTRGALEADVKAPSIGKGMWRSLHNPSDPELAERSAALHIWRSEEAQDRIWVRTAERVEVGNNRLLMPRVVMPGQGEAALARLDRSPFFGRAGSVGHA